MKLKDFESQVQLIIGSVGNNHEYELVIPVAGEGGIGASPAASVTGISFGFDHDAGKIFIRPVEPLVRARHFKEYRDKHPVPPRRLKLPPRKKKEFMAQFESLNAWLLWAMEHKASAGPEERKHYHQCVKEAKAEFAKILKDLKK